jgi:Zn-finger nucleic acid-binding protein
MEAKTLHCQSCGAAVGEADLQCPYCRSQLATVACPRCFGMVLLHATHCSHCGAAIQPVAAAPSALDCPSCRTSLAASTLGGLALDQCGTCGGLWVDQKTFEAIAAAREARGEVLGALPAHEHGTVTLAEVHYRPCPCCAKLMNRYNYAHISGVVLDVCKEHGLWFDRDELRQVLAFIEGGGLERSRSHEVEALAEERRLKAAPPLPTPGGAWAEQPPDGHYGGPGLTGVVESLMSLFFR